MRNLAEDWQHGTTAQANGRPTYRVGGGDNADLERALAHGKAKGMRLGEALINLQLASEAAVYKALAAQHGMEYFDLDKVGSAECGQSHPG